MIYRQPFRITLVLMCTAFAPVSNADQAPAPPINIPIPDSPAASSIGSIGTVLRPSTAREFAVSLANAIDRNGKVKPTISMELSPYLLFNKGMPISGYGDAVDIIRSKQLGRTKLKANPFSPIWTLANTSLSVATGAKDGTNEFSKRASLGLKVPLFDEGDPRLNYAYSKCIEDLDKASPTPSIDPMPGTTAKSAERIKAEAACAAKANKLHWNRTAAALAYAQSYLDTGDATKANLTRDARISWASFAYGYNLDMKGDGRSEGDGAGQFILQARDTKNAIDSKAKAGSNVRYDGVAGYARWRFGGNEQNFDVSAARETRKYSDGRRDNVTTISVGAEIKAGDYWLSLSFGKEMSDIGGSKPVVLANFNWAFNNEANLKPK